MPSEPFPPYPSNQDPDRTTPYRHPASGPTPGPYTQQPYAQAAYPPGDRPAWQQGELGHPLPPAEKSGRGWLLAIIAAVLVVAIGGGSVYAITLLSGGGTQPENVLPASALAYVRVDLDPAANQKVALFNIARKFSATKKSFAGDDPRKALFDMMREDSENADKLDYARDVEPWLGSRIGLGMLAPKSGSDEPEVVAAIQVTDEAKAREGLAELNKDGGMSGVAFREDYAILAETQVAADKYAKEAPLSQNADFTADLDALGEPGVLSFWGDLGKIAKVAGKSLSDQKRSLDMVGNARVAGALRFDSGYAELTGISRGSDVRAPADLSPVPLAGLPDSTAAALSVSGLGEMLGKQWPELTKAADGASGGRSFSDFVTKARDSYGIALPADLVTLLGKNVTLALDGQGLDGEVPNVGALLATDPAKAQEVVTKLEKLIADSGTGAPQIAKKATEDRLILASSQQYADQLAGSGKLGDSELFKTAIPNADSATAALFVDLDKLEKLYLESLQGESRANLKALRAVGLSGSQSGDTASFSLRVLFN